MKKLLFLTIAALAALPMSLSAENPYIFKSGDKKPTEYKKIEVKDSKTYNVTYLKGGRGIVPMDAVDYVWIPKPESVAVADTLAQSGEHQKAADSYLAAEAEYKLLGWSPYCRFEAAKSLIAAKQFDAAIKILAPMRNEDFKNPNDKKYTVEASLLLGNAYMTSEKYTIALDYAKELSKKKEDILASAGYMYRGQIYRMQAKAEKDEDAKTELLTKAAYAYFGAALLFKDTKTRPEALFASYEILKELKDARGGEFAKILKEEYPDNEYTKRLK